MYLNLCHTSIDGLRLSVKVVFPLRGVNLDIIYIYYGRGPCSNPNRMDGILAALLLGHNQAPPPLYDPSQDYCFGDKTNTEKYGEKCWFFADTVPFGNWELINPCGELC